MESTATSEKMNRAMAAGAGSQTRPVGVVVALPTFRRNDTLPGLISAVLGRISEVDEARWAVRVVVIDNDPGAGAKGVVEPLGGSTVSYLHEPRPGISAVRNRAIDVASDASLLVMMDDDELPGPGWLTALLAMWEKSAAAVVQGGIKYRFTSELDPWVEAGRFHDPRRRPIESGAEMRVAATGNILLDLEQVRPTSIRFSEEFGLSGGEDSLFTRSLHATGLRIVYCPESTVVELVPEERLTRDWALARARWRGNVATRVEVQLARGPVARFRARCVGFVKGLVRCGVGVWLWCFGTLRRDLASRAGGLRDIVTGAGRIAGAMNFAYYPYARPLSQGSLTARR